MVSKGAIKDDVMRMCRERFNRFEIDNWNLEYAVSHVVDNHGEEASRLPKIIGDLFEYADKIKARVGFGEMVDFCTTIGDERNGIMDLLHKRYNEPQSLGPNNLNVYEFAEYLENGGSTINPLSNFEVYPMPQRQDGNIDPVMLTEDKKRLAAYWLSARAYGESSQSKVVKFLLKIQAEHGDFRTWLEAQQQTKHLAQDFGTFGLNYSAWDDSNVAYGYKGKLERIICNVGNAIAAAQDLTIALTKGNFTGYLKRSPKLVFRNIGPIYRNLVESEDVLNLLTALKEDIDEKYLKQGELAKTFRKVEALATDSNPELAGRDYDFVFRTWRRQPSYDFCEGNHSGVCVSFGGSNGLAVPKYLVDKGVSLMDFYMDGKRHGQLFFIAGYSDQSREPVLFLDSFESSRGHAATSVRDKTFDGVYDVAQDLGRRAGFKHIFFQHSASWRNSQDFRDYVTRKHMSDRNGAIYFEGHPSLSSPYFVFSKIRGAEPIKLLSPVDGDGSLYNNGHYFDLGGWSNVTNRSVVGLLVGVEKNDK